MSMIKMRLIKSPIGKPESHKKTVQALGLRKIGKIVERKDTPQIRGMIAKVGHMVEIVE